MPGRGRPRAVKKAVRIHVTAPTDLLNDAREVADLNRQSLSAYLRDLIKRDTEKALRGR